MNGLPFFFVADILIKNKKKERYKYSMTKGVIFFNRGTKCMTRMILAVYTLRKYYKGSITVLTMGEQDPEFIRIMYEMDCKTLAMPNLELKTLAVKTTLYHFTPYDLTLFVDADFIFVKGIDDVWDQIKENTYVVNWFERWITTGGQSSKRIKRMSAVCPEYVEPTLHYGKSVNTGIFGFTKDAPILKELEELAEKTWKAGVNSVITDEIAAQMLLHKYPHALLDREWGVSGKFGKVIDGETVACHYHGKKSYEEYLNCHLYKQLFWECYRKTGWDFILQNHGLRRENRYLKKTTYKSLSIVTAVDRKYLPKFKVNFEKWIKTAGIMEYPIIVFYDKKTLNGCEVGLITGKGVKLVAWDFEAETQRERMLSAFVFGAAEHVKTKYWLKLDCDSYPNDNIKVEHGWQFDIPDDWSSYMAVGNRCGYIKGIGFIPKLEEWGDKIAPETKRLYDDMTEEQKTKWLRVPCKKRFASYFCLYKTSFTRWLSEHCINKRLPIPSEDSTTSYILLRLNKPFKREKMKKYFSPR